MDYSTTITCHECGKILKGLGSHLRHTHKMELKEYLAKYPGSPTKSEATRKKYSNIMKQWYVDDPTRGLRNIERVHTFLRNNPEINRRNGISTFNRPDVRTKASESSRRTLQSPEYRAKLSIIRKEYYSIESNKDHLCRNGRLSMNKQSGVWHSSNCRMNKLESRFNDLTPDCIEFVSGKLFRTNSAGKAMSPDFKVRDERIIIELYGNYWHTPHEATQRIKYWNELGYHCYILWESDFNNSNNDSIIKVLTFIEESKGRTIQC